MRGTSRFYGYPRTIFGLILMAGWLALGFGVLVTGYALYALVTMDGDPLRGIAGQLNLSLGLATVLSGLLLVGFGLIGTLLCDIAAGATENEVEDRAAARALRAGGRVPPPLRRRDET